MFNGFILLCMIVFSHFLGSHLSKHSSILGSSLCSQRTTGTSSVCQQSCSQDTWLLWEVFQSQLPTQKNGWAYLLEDTIFYAYSDLLVWKLISYQIFSTIFWYIFAWNSATTRSEYSISNWYYNPICIGGASTFKTLPTGIFRFYLKRTGT